MREAFCKVVFYALFSDNFVTTNLEGGKGGQIDKDQAWERERGRMGQIDKDKVWEREKKNGIGR